MLNNTKQAPSDDVSLSINGMIYSGWTAISFSRGIDRMTSAFSIGVTERWDGTGALWQIKPGDQCTLKIGSDTVLTGYVNAYEPEFDSRSHHVTIAGRSKTQDLYDCTPDIKGGQFRGYTLEQIARAVCDLFGIKVVLQTEADQRFPDVTIARTETSFSFLERLARLSGVLLTDDAMGNLVLTTAGQTHAVGLLVQGQNILRASAKLDDSRRFSIYVVKGQSSLGSTQPGWDGYGNIPAPPPIAAVVTNQRATASDTGVTRFRPHISMAEAQLDQAGMQRRVNWERNFAFGRSVSAEITVQGWRQSDGSLWQVNQLVSCTVPFLQINQDLLIASVDHRIDDHSGRTTTLKVGPVEGYTPDPGQVKVHCKRGKKGKTAPQWDGYGVGAN